MNSFNEKPQLKELYPFTYEQFKIFYTEPCKFKEEIRNSLEIFKFHCEKNQYSNAQIFDSLLNKLFEDQRKILFNDQSIYRVLQDSFYNNCSFSKKLDILNESKYNNVFIQRVDYPEQSDFLLNNKYRPFTSERFYYDQILEQWKSDVSFVF